jgi:hypothetical protein
MGWLKVDQHWAVADTDANVQAAIAALRVRLEEHAEVRLSIKDAKFRGPTFVINRTTVLSAPESLEEVNADLFAALTEKSARNSGDIYWFQDGRGFVSETNSRKW